MELNFELWKYLALVTGVIAFAVVYTAIPTIIDVSHLKSLFDDPHNERKLHTDKTPNLGGIALFAGLIIAFPLSGYANVQWMPYLAAGLSILFFSGIKDDILVIAYRKKLLLQAAAILILMGGTNLVITDFGGVFGYQEIPQWAGAGITFFTMVVVINAYNLIDGVDGLAGSIGVIISLFFGWWFWDVGMMSHAAFSFALTGALVGFLCYNFEPASIFMGDTGSQIIGYAMAFLAVSFVKAGVAMPAAPFHDAVPVLVLAVLIVPLYDTLRVFLTRALRGNSPFEADRSHVHHQLIDMGFSHRSCCYILGVFNAVIIGLTMTMSGMEVNLLFASVLGISVVLFPTARFKRDLLQKMGIHTPSRREIKILELKYGMQAKPFSKKKNGHFPDKDDDLEEIAV